MSNFAGGTICKSELVASGGEDIAILFCLWGMARGRGMFRLACWLCQTLQLQGLLQLTPAPSLHLLPFNLSFQSTGVHTPPGESLASLISTVTMSCEPCVFPSFHLICGLKADLSRQLKAWWELLHPQSLVSACVWRSPAAWCQGRCGDAPTCRGMVGPWP